MLFTKENAEKVLISWRSSRCEQIELAGLISRNPTAHKWKATYRSLVLRELVYWRLEDLLTQTVILWKLEHYLGSLIILRSAIETLSILIYINLKIEAVLSGEEQFFKFDKLTSSIMLGSKNQSTKFESINIMSVLELSNKKYPGLLNFYSNLSESAHPNYQGVCGGYSDINEEKFITKFSNQQDKEQQEKIPLGIELCMRTFECEYNVVWCKNFKDLEDWLKINDAHLENTKNH